VKWSRGDIWILIVISTIFVVAALWMLFPVPPAVAPTQGHPPSLPPPHELVCSAEAYYEPQQDATLKRGGDYAKYVIGGVFTVNTDTGAVHGEVVINDEWKVINHGDAVSAAKLIAADRGDFVALTILVYKPDTSGIYDLYPFTYLDGRDGSVVTGRCRAHH